MCLHMAGKERAPVSPPHPKRAPVSPIGLGLHSILLSLHRPCLQIQSYQGLGLQPMNFEEHSTEFITGRLCVIACLEASLASRHYIPAAIPVPSVTTKDVSRRCPLGGSEVGSRKRGVKSPLIKNHCSMPKTIKYFREKHLNKSMSYS
uniref:Uncharacterized protein n=1 Tax=Rousettus aegyptiacus TaxID=9407 RepID=A0A7J8BRU5_ROUAE|nr:hypothetical protein HJG63_009608 [Rousettus aegyptiacus]